MNKRRHRSLLDFGRGESVDEFLLIGEQLRYLSRPADDLIMQVALIGDGANPVFSFYGFIWEACTRGCLKYEPAPMLSNLYQLLLDRPHQQGVNINEAPALLRALSKIPRIRFGLRRQDPKFENSTKGYS